MDPQHESAGPPAPASGARPLRVGLLLDSFRQPAWVARIVEHLLAAEYADVALVVLNDTPPERRQSGPRRAWDNRDYWLLAAYSKTDRLLFRKRVKSDPFAMRDLGDALARVPVRHVTPVRKKFSDYFSDTDLEAVRAQNLDVLLRFGFRILRGGILDAARYGVWSHHHGDNRVNRGSPPGFWEVMDQVPLTGSILQILTEELDGGRVLYRSVASTDRASVFRNRSNFYWKTSDFVIRKLGELHTRGPSALEAEQHDRNGLAAPYSHPLYRKPTNTQMARCLVRLGARIAREEIAKRTHIDQWHVGYAFGPRTQSLHRYKFLTPPLDRDWADPFPVKHGDSHFVFIEELLYESRKGHIAVMELTASGEPTAPRTVLERPYHLSYPFVIEHEGTFYMIPETCQSRRVELYKATRFPDTWELVTVLLEDVNAVDATLHRAPHGWWMFVNIGVDGASRCDELHLFRADSLLGPYRPHNRNPVKSDVRSSRPAGRLFEEHGALYRPAQDCSKRYGYAVSINRIDVLDENRFQETEVGRITPDWDRKVLGVHTWNRAGELNVIDAQVRRRRGPR